MATLELPIHPSIKYLSFQGELKLSWQSLIYFFDCVNTSFQVNPTQ